MAESLVLPPFREDGYLPEGVHRATESEVVFRFGATTPRRRELALRLRHWIELGKKVSARRLLVDGSFVTSKPEPGDVDALILLPVDFYQQVNSGSEDALELDAILVNRGPEELFGAEDDEDWREWVEFFSRTRENDGRRKGLVEIILT